MTVESSPLIRKDYWNDFYRNEYINFCESGLEGEEWFEQDMNRVLKSIKGLQNIEKKRWKILDVGCGNGFFLVRLARMGFKRLYGCDYIPTAVTLALGVCRNGLKSLYNGDWDEAGSRDDDPADERTEESLRNAIKDTQIRLSVMDITCNNPACVDETQNSDSSSTSNDRDYEGDVLVIENSELGHFDLIHDKGTFDVFFMRGDGDLYFDSICRHFVKLGSHVCITSCNATEKELIHCMTKRKISVFDHSSEQAFKIQFQCVQTIVHRSFSFGGQTGQVVSTAIFKANHANDEIHS